MSRFRNTRKTIALLCMVVFFNMTILPVQAAMIGNDQIIAQASNQLTIDQLVTALDREEIQNQLIAMGVNPEDAKLRISQMTESELAEVQQHLDEMPAGGISVLGAALLIFIILIITDMLGATDIFPFVHNINK